MLFQLDGTVGNLSSVGSLPPNQVPSPETSLSNFQRGEVVVHALTLAELYRQQNDGVDGKTASNIAAEVGFVTASTVREWERRFLARGHIKVSAVGRWERNWLLGIDEGIVKECKDWTRAFGGILKGEANKTAEDFRQFINKDIIMPKIEALATPDYDPFKELRVMLVEEKKGEPKKRQISLSTAQAWLLKLGCEYHEGKGGLFCDTHDDDKVVELRNKTCLPELFKHRQFADVWIPMTVAEAKAWGVNISALGVSDRTADGGVWVCVDDLEPALVELSEELQKTVTSKRRYEDGKKALLCYEDESIFRGTVLYSAAT